MPRARRAAAAQPLRRLHGREASGDVQLAPGSELGRHLGRRAARRAAVLRGMMGLRVSRCGMYLTARAVEPLLYATGLRLEVFTLNTVESSVVWQEVVGREGAPFVAAVLTNVLVDPHFVGVRLPSPSEFGAHEAMAREPLLDARFGELRAALASIDGTSHSEANALRAIRRMERSLQFLSLSIGLKTKEVEVRDAAKRGRHGNVGVLRALLAGGAHPRLESDDAASSAAPREVDQEEQAGVSAEGVKRQRHE